MHSVVFGLSALAILFFYGMLHTIFFARKIKRETENKQKYMLYGSKLGFYGFLSFFLAIIIYYGVG